MRLPNIGLEPPRPSCVLEAISQLPKKNSRAGEEQEPGEVGGAALIARDQSAGVLEPGEEPLHFPPALVAA